MANTVGTAAVHRILAALKKHRPATVRAHLADGEHKDLAVSQSRQRWQGLMTVLGELSWTRLEFLDTRARVVAIIDNDGPALEAEDLGGADRASAVGARELHLVRLIITAQDQAVMRHTEALRPVLEANRAMLRDLTEQITFWRREAGRNAEHAHNLIEQLQRISEAADAGDDAGALGQVKELMGLLPMLGQLGLLPMGKPPQVPAPARPAPARPAPARPAPAPAPAP